MSLSHEAAMEPREFAWLLTMNRDLRNRAFEEKFYSDEFGRYARAIINGKPDFTVDSA